MHLAFWCSRCSIFLLARNAMLSITIWLMMSHQIFFRSRCTLSFWKLCQLRVTVAWPWRWPSRATFPSMKSRSKLSKIFSGKKPIPQICHANWEFEFSTVHVLCLMFPARGVCVFLICSWTVTFFKTPILNIFSVCNFPMTTTFEKMSWSTVAKSTVSVGCSTTSCRGLRPCTRQMPSQGASWPAKNTNSRRMLGIQFEKN